MYKKNNMVWMLSIFVFLLIPQVAYAQGDTNSETSNTVLFFLIGVINLGLTLWVLRDAKEHGEAAKGWAIVVILFGVLGLPIYLYFRPKLDLVTCGVCHQKKPAQALVCPHCGAKRASSRDITPSNKSNQRP